MGGQEDTAAVTAATTKNGHAVHVTKGSAGAANASEPTAVVDPIRPPAQIVSHVLRVSLRALLLGYAIRGGLDFLLKLRSVARRKLSLRDAFLRGFFGEDAFRLAGFFGSFAFLWKLTNDLLRFYRRKDDKWNGFASGAVAGVALLCERPSRRVSIAQQLLVRGLQSSYNAVKARGLFHFPLGDSLIFALASAQVMYAYALRPNSIPRSFYKFILKTGPINEETLKLIRKQIREEPMTVPEVVAAVAKQSGTARALEFAASGASNPAAAPSGWPIVPCEILHPTQDSCVLFDASVFVSVFSKIIPVYLSLNVVPMLVLKTVELSKRNLIASKILFRKDTKFSYWIIGFLSSLSIFLEAKNRRSELAMYVLPRGVDSLYRLLYNRKWIVKVPHFEVLMFSVAMGLILAFYQTEPNALSPFLYRLLNRVNLTIEDRRPKRSPSASASGDDLKQVQAVVVSS
ncbi:hypothetical protein HK102_004388, partial [Quaeritorhiza haematococci]